MSIIVLIIGENIQKVKHFTQNQFVFDKMYFIILF